MTTTSTSKQGSLLEEALSFQLKAVGAPTPERQYRFHPTRKWRFDFAWPDKKVAVEVQGGLWSKGAHTQPMWLVKEYEKLATAASLGWRVLPVHKGSIDSGEAVSLIEKALAL